MKLNPSDEDHLREGLWMILISLQLRAQWDIIANVCGIKDEGRQCLDERVVELYKAGISEQAKQEGLSPEKWEIVKEIAINVAHTYQVVQEGAILDDDAISALFKLGSETETEGGDEEYDF